MNRITALFVGVAALNRRGSCARLRTRLVLQWATLRAAARHGLSPATGPAAYPWTSDRTCGFIFTTETMIDRGPTTATGTMMMIKP